MVHSLQARFVGLILALFLAFGGLVPDTAHAQSCPSSAFKGGTITAGTRVRLVALSEADAYYSDRGTIVGKTGTVDQLDPTGGGGKSACWYGGQFYGDDGSSFYFYQVAVELVSGGSVVSAGTGCPSGAYTGAVPTPGTRVRILTVSSQDAYYGSRSDYGLEGGKIGRVDTGWSKTGEPCWYAGQFYGDDGSSFYFYQAAIEIQSGSSGGIVSGGGTACPGGAATAGMAEGTRVKVLGIHPEDAYFGDSASLIGLQGRVSGDLHSNDGCWMGGGFTADNGAYYYFYKAAVANLGAPAVAATGCPAGSYSGSVPASGTRVKILTVSTQDAYYASRYDYGLEGKVGRVDAAWSKTGEPCWYAGQFYGDDGSSYYFYQAAIEILGSTGAVTAAGDRYMGGALSSGQRFRIVALHPDDAYYSTRAQLIGKHCTATDAMASQGSGWFSGPVRCTDGTESYFYKVGVVLE